MPGRRGRGESRSAPGKRTPPSLDCWDVLREASNDEQLRRGLPDVHLRDPRRQEAVVGAVDAHVPEAVGEVPHLEPEPLVDARGGGGGKGEAGEDAAKIGGKLLRGR